MPDLIGPNVVVTIDYILRDSDGDILDQSEAGDPLTYLQGHDNIVPGLEKALEGKKVGDTVHVAVAPEEGYGERDPNGIRVVERSSFPDDAEVEPGIQFFAELDDGDQIPMWIAAVEGDEVHIDMNHPLAGVTLYFDVTVVELRDAHPSELTHGHPHGRDGGEHHHH